ncbi:MAG: hypothetical protein WCI96_11335 [Planctomycetota bacterium]
MSDNFLPPHFGTDGLRGRAGEEPMEPETLRRVGAALGVLLQRSGGEHVRVICGNDGRESAPWILEALTQGLVAAEVAVTDDGVQLTEVLLVGDDRLGDLPYDELDVGDGSAHLASS